VENRKCTSPRRHGPGLAVELLEPEPNGSIRFTVLLEPERSRSNRRADDDESAVTAFRLPRVRYRAVCIGILSDRRCTRALPVGFRCPRVGTRVAPLGFHSLRADSRVVGVGIVHLGIATRPAAVGIAHVRAGTRPVGVALNLIGFSTRSAAFGFSSVRSKSRSAPLGSRFLHVETQGHSRRIAFHRLPRPFCGGRISLRACLQASSQVRTVLLPSRTGIGSGGGLIHPTLRQFITLSAPVVYGGNGLCPLIRQ